MKITEWLEAQKKLLAAATPGPWKWRTVQHYEQTLQICEGKEPFLETLNGISSSNRKFIASVRTEHERALKLIEKMREALDKIANPGTQSLYECRSVSRQALTYFPEDGENL